MLTVLCKAMCVLKPLVYSLYKARRLTALVGIGMAVVLSGCATTASPPFAAAPHIVSQRHDLNADIAADLLSTLPQLLEPLSTTLQFNNPDSGDIRPIVTRLVELGYGVQKVDADQGSHFIRLQDLSSSEDIANRTTKLRLAIGELEFERSYKVFKESGLRKDQEDFLWRRGVAVVPAGPLIVSGTSAELELLGFQLAQPELSESRELVAGSVVYTDSPALVDGVPAISLITEDVVKRVAESATGVTDYNNRYSNSFTLENMTHVEDSAFAAITDSHNRVTREIVVFPDDSTVLGAPAKAQIKRVIDRYTKSSDVVGIIGCSTGRTTLAMGNEGLALGRATRVAEEFFTAGIGRDKVFNEGCWSTDENDLGLPNRGVVIDLWRRKS